MRSEGYSSCHCPLVGNSPLKRLFALKTLLHTQRATKVKTFVGFSLKPVRFGDQALPPLDGHTCRRPFFYGKHACVLPPMNMWRLQRPFIRCGNGDSCAFCGSIGRIYHQARSHLTYGAFVRPENAVTYSAGNKGRNICGDLSETTAFKSYAAKHERRSQYAYYSDLPAVSFLCLTHSEAPEGTQRLLTTFSLAQNDAY